MFPSTTDLQIMWPIIEEIELKTRSLSQLCWYLVDGIVARTETILNKDLDV